MVGEFDTRFCWRLLKAVCLLSLQNQQQLELRKEIKLDILEMKGEKGSWTQYQLVPHLCVSTTKVDTHRYTVVIWCSRPDITHGMKTQTQEELCHATDKQACASGTHIFCLSSTILHLQNGKSWRWMKNLCFSFNAILIINYKVRFLVIHG